MGVNLGSASRLKSDSSSDVLLSFPVLIHAFLDCDFFCDRSLLRDVEDVEMRNDFGDLNEWKSDGGGAGATSFEAGGCDEILGACVLTNESAASPWQP